MAEALGFGAAKTKVPLETHPMSHPDCNADLDHPCDGGPDGEPCESCQAYREASMADARRSYAVRSPAERDPAQYREDMIDAGRGHLLSPEER